MKKVLLFLTGLLCCGAGLLSISKGTTEPMISVYAEEEITEQVEPTEPVDEIGTVIIDATITHGKIVADLEIGDVGDVVTLTITPDAFYALSSISVNGVSLTASEGVYSFQLVAGNNIVYATFVIDDATVSKFAEIYNNVISGDWRNVFTLENVLFFVSFLINSGFGLALVSIYSKYKKSKTVDRKDVINAIEQVLPEQASTIINGMVDTTLIPMLTPILEQMKNVEEAMAKFIQAFLYSLDGTVDSKEKIIEILSGLKLSDANTTDELKNWIKNEMERLQLQYEENKKLLKELKETSEKALNNTVSIVSNTVNGENEGATVDKTKEGNYDGTEI